MKYKKTIFSLCFFGLVSILPSALLFKQNNTKSQTQSLITTQKLNTRWIKGVIVNQDDFFHIVDDDLDFYATVNSSGKGWYDINKEFDGRDTWLCSGIVATNMLHWWLEQNQDNIQKYLSFSDEKGVITLPNNQKKDIRDLRKTYEKDGYVDQSNFFDFIKTLFGTKTLFPDKVLDTYINGYFFTNRPQANPQTKNRIKRSSGFFSEVFNEQKLTQINYIYNKNNFTNVVKDAIENNKAMAVSYFGGSQGIGHVISIWGADFDSEGNVEAVYITDSDDNSKRIPDNNKKIGIIRYRVIEDARGGVKLTSYKDENSGAKVANIYTLSLGQNLWDRYFDNHEKMIIKKQDLFDQINNKINNYKNNINEFLNDNFKNDILNQLNNLQNEFQINLNKAIWETEVLSEYKNFESKLNEIEIIIQKQKHISYVEKLIKNIQTQHILDSIKIDELNNFLILFINELKSLQDLNMINSLFDEVIKKIEMFKNKINEQKNEMSNSNESDKNTNQLIKDSANNTPESSSSNSTLKPENTDTNSTKKIEDQNKNPNEKLTPDNKSDQPKQDLSNDDKNKLKPDNNEKKEHYKKPIIISVSLISIFLLIITITFIIIKQKKLKNKFKYQTERKK